MRGKVREFLFFRFIFGITPAYAGKSGKENHRSPQGTGSPPPMRGKDFRQIGHQTAVRITPAYAGKSQTEKTLLSSGEDHPRLCGEKGFCIAGDRAIVGSPPPMRGKDFPPTNPLPCMRITPAYAGKSRTVTTKQRTLQDHPRLCGEKAHHPSGNTKYTGSPPPMRGKD